MDRTAGQNSNLECHGLAKHSQEIKTFIFNQNIDILLVSETYFTRTISAFLDIHCIIMHPNGEAHGGTTLIIRKHYEIGKY
jgi:hypothetical protein